MVVIATVAAIARAEAQPPALAISIEDAVRAAASASPVVAAAHATTERAEHDVAAARAAYLPQVSATSSYVRTLRTEFEGLFELDPGGAGSPFPGFGDRALPFGSPHTWRAGVDVTQHVFDGGRTRGAVAIAQQTRVLAALDERGKRAQAVLDVTRAYYDAALAADTVAIGEASLALAEQTLAQARVGFAQGATAEYDLVRAEVTRDNQRTSLVKLRADRELALVRLRRALGLPLDRPIVLTTPLGRGDPAGLAHRVAGVPPGTIHQPVAEARANRDVRVAQLGLARAARWPQVSAFTSLGVVDYPRDFWVDRDWRTNWTVGVSLSLPLFTGFRTTAEIAGARADRRAAEALVVEATRQTAVAARQANSDVDVARATFASSSRSAALAQRAADIADVRYRQGVSSYLELADARLALDQARINAATAARDLEVARTRVALFPALPLAEVPGLASSTQAILSVTPRAEVRTPPPPRAFPGLP